MVKQLENESLSENPFDGTEEILLVLNGIKVRVRSDVAAQILVGQEEWAAEKRGRANAAYDAIERYRQRPSQHHKKAALDAIQSYSFYYSSEHCLLPVLRLIEFTPSAIFWPALMNAWYRCDATWDYRARLLWNMKRARKPALAYFLKSQRQFFETLPPVVRVFRGCSAPHVRRFSWTADRAVAEEFARGHRGIPVLEPVVASALIPKEHIFFVTDERQEKAIVLNPRRLRKVFIEPFEGV